jgi:Arc/MetJ-type ribon-helix-helix transcriptional regulator
MKTVAVEVPEQVAKQMEELVHAGWFVSEAELARQALVNFVQQARFQLQERFQKEDIEWALRLKKSRG